MINNMKKVESSVDGSGRAKYNWKDGSCYDRSWEDNKLTGYGVDK